jgi:MFS transporter, PHS family, inorganic phosphate transporter
LTASVITCILLAIFKHPLTHGAFGQIDAIWRLQIGLALVPCFALIYFRLTMPESRKFLQSMELSSVSKSSLNSATSLNTNTELKTTTGEAI